MKKLLIVSLTIVMLSGCGYRTVKSASTVPAGTQVSYAKAMNPAYAKDYIGADIVTEVEFYASGKSNAWQTKVPKKHIVFQVVPIDGSPKSSPLGGSIGDYVFVPKASGDIIFDLKQGDKIQLRGGTRIRKGAFTSVEIVEFIATSVTRL